MSGKNPACAVQPLPAAELWCDNEHQCCLPAPHLSTSPNVPRVPSVPPDTGTPHRHWRAEHWPGTERARQGAPAVDCLLLSLAQPLRVGNRDAPELLPSSLLTPGTGRGEGSGRRQQEEVLPDGLWYKPPPSLTSQPHSAAGNGGGGKMMRLWVGGSPRRGWKPPRQ